MTRVGEFNGAIIIDDYGHHPTEIAATLAALRTRYQPRRLICVFNPTNSAELDCCSTILAAVSSTRI